MRTYYSLLVTEADLIILVKHQKIPHSILAPPQYDERKKTSADQHTAVNWMFMKSQNIINCNIYDTVIVWHSSFVIYWTKLCLERVSGIWNFWPTFNILSMNFICFLKFNKIYNTSSYRNLNIEENDTKILSVCWIVPEIYQIEPFKCQK